MKLLVRHVHCWLIQIPLKTCFCNDAYKVLLGEERESTENTNHPEVDMPYWGSLWSYPHLSVVLVGSAISTQDCALLPILVLLKYNLACFGMPEKWFNKLLKHKWKCALGHHLHWTERLRRTLEYGFSSAPFQQHEWEQQIPTVIKGIL